MCSLLTCTAAFADDTVFPGVEKLMTTQEYEAAGLDKLSPEEMQALNKWLIGYTVEDASVMRQNNEEVQAAEKAIEISGNIKQPFSGWTGKTVFYLDNGQVWRQRVSGRYQYKGSNTAVLIDKNLIGFYRMTLVDSGRSIGVSRVK